MTSSFLAGTSYFCSLQSTVNYITTTLQRGRHADEPGTYADDSADEPGLNADDSADEPDTTADDYADEPGTTGTMLLVIQVQLGSTTPTNRAQPRTTMLAIQAQLGSNTTEADLPNDA